MLPDENNMSPVAQLARNKLLTAAWASKLPQVCEVDLISVYFQPRFHPQLPQTTPAAASTTAATSAPNNVPALRGPAQPAPATTPTNPLLGQATPRRAPPLVDHTSLLLDGVDPDSDENKYARRPPGQWLAQVVR